MYQLDIVGNGRVTLSLLKTIFGQQLDRYIKKINVWCRESLSNDKVINKKDSINEDIFRIYLMQRAKKNELNKLDEKVEFKTFNCIDDLVQLSNGNGKKVLILAAKYNLDELIYIDKAKKEKIRPDYLSHFELLLSRMKLIIPGISSLYISQGYDLRKKILLNSKHILNERILLRRAINELSQSISAGFTRLYNLEHSGIGVKYLSQVLKNYNGNIFNMINEVDTTNSILQHFSGLKPETITSPCENDNIRARFFLRKQLKLQGINIRSISLDYIGPHNHTGFIPPETVKVNGRPLDEIMNKKTALDVIEEVTNKVNGFGEEVFLKKGSSDEDTVMGICSALSSLFKKAGTPLVRVSCYDKNYDLYSGLPGSFRGEQFEPKKHIISNLSHESAERLLNANKEQMLITQNFMSAIEPQSQLINNRFFAVY